MYAVALAFPLTVIKAHDVNTPVLFAPPSRFGVEIIHSDISYRQVMGMV